MSYNAIGKVWTIESFQQELSKINKPAWCNAVCLHHTALPSLQMRPKGLLLQHIHNMKSGYVAKGWKSGPHLYIDEDQIYGMTPLTERGVHAVSFNARAIGIEVLGDYDEESPHTGRGQMCWDVAAATTRALAQWLQIPINDKNILFHRDDPKTSKTCPGKLIDKPWFLSKILNASVAPAAQPCDCKVEFAPVLQYVIDHKGYDAAAAGKLIKKKNGLFYFGDDWLEDAYYDANKQCTMASIRELQQIKSAGA